MNDMVLEATGLSYTFPCGKKALRGLSVRIGKRRKVAIVGPNGSGKSTLLLCLNGAYRPQAGALKLDGESVSYSGPALREWRRRVGLVFQDPDDQVVAPSVLQDVAFGPLNLGMKPAAARDCAVEALGSLGIECLGDSGTHELSHGQKKLVALAGVLAMKPDVILLDEPTAGLDPAGRRKVLAVLDQLHAAGSTIVMATHDMDLAYAWADEVAVLKDGATLAAGPAEAVFRDTSVLETAALETPLVATVGSRLRQCGALAASETARTADAIVAALGRLPTPAAAGPAADAAALHVDSRAAPRKGILLIAFGTTIPEAQKAYWRIEKTVRNRLPACDIRWAFTSATVRRRLAAAGQNFDAPAQALERMVKDGCTHIAVQSLHIIRGQEYDGMKAEIEAVKDRMSDLRSVAVGLPLLSSASDIHRVAEALVTELAPRERQAGEAVVWAGHGSAHPGDQSYGRLDAALRALDPLTVLGTVEGAITCDAVIADVVRSGAKTAWLLPFMTVAGDHARNDLAGDDPESWKSRIEAAGIRCRPVLKGIAEHDAIAAVWEDHLAAAWRVLE